MGREKQGGERDGGRGGGMERKRGGGEGGKEKGGGRRSDVKHSKKDLGPLLMVGRKNRKWMRIHLSCMQDGLGGCRGMSTPLSLWCH